LRHLRPHHPGDSPGRRDAERRWAMNHEPPAGLNEPERYELFEEPRYRFEPDRRDFMKALGGGLLVCLVAQDAVSQRFGPRGPSELGAWLHIGEDGQVTVYTGKVEVGQNIRTSL